MMRDDDGNVVTVPISLLKEEYKNPAKVGWEKYRKPVDEFTHDEWVECGLVEGDD